MKRLVLLFALCLCLTGCKTCQQRWGSIKSATVGLDRKVTLYALDGTEIKSWEGRINIEANDKGLRMVLPDGKIVRLNGTYVVEQK